MDPLISNGVDPALLRVLEKRGQEREPEPRRKRPTPAPESPVEEEKKEEQEPDPDAPKHELDDLA